MYLSKLFLSFFFSCVGISLAALQGEEDPSSSLRRRRLDDPGYTIEELVVDNWYLQELEDLLKAANLAPSGTFSGEGPFTLLAPTNQAFRQAFRRYPGLETLLLNDADGALTTVLTYHASASKILSSDVTRDGLTVTTMSDEELTAITECRWWGWWCYVKLTDGSSYPTYASWGDVEAANGVVHFIDKVLIPPSLADTVAGLKD